VTVFSVGQKATEDKSVQQMIVRPVPPLQPSASSAAQLSHLHWQVLRLALRECPGRIRSYWRGLMARLIHHHLGPRFGWRAKSPLANEGLEALRQYVCLSTEPESPELGRVRSILSKSLDIGQMEVVATFVETSLRGADNPLKVSDRGIM
jgi:hypothetical protein